MVGFGGPNSTSVLIVSKGSRTDSREGNRSVKMISVQEEVGNFSMRGHLSTGRRKEVRTRHQIKENREYPYLGATVLKGGS